MRVSYTWSGNSQRFTVVYYDSEYRNGEFACQNGTISTSAKVVAKKVNQFFGTEVVKPVAYGIEEI